MRTWIAEAGAILSAAFLVVMARLRAEITEDATMTGIMEEGNEGIIIEVRIMMRGVLEKMEGGIIREIFAMKTGIEGGIMT
jgi:hypothetical protein